MVQPQVSIVIPCYNHGHYLHDALESVKQCDAALYEVIIVNDGSTDTATIDVLKELELQGYTVIHKPNGGLSSARNAGIAVAKGAYILPLDADNKIRPEYLTESIRQFETDSEIGVVYGDAAYFGEKTGVWRVGGFNQQKLMLNNFIDACAVIRKSVFDQIGGYDTDLKNGLEDWEYWLRMSFAGFKFAYVNKVLFDYRVMITSMSGELRQNYIKRNSAILAIEEKYKHKMGGDHVVGHIVTRFKKNPLLFIIKLAMKAWLPSAYDRLLKKNKIARGL